MARHIPAFAAHNAHQGKTQTQKIQNRSRESHPSMVIVYLFVGIGASLAVVVAGLIL